MSVFKRQLAVPLLGTEEFINDTILHFTHIGLMIISLQFYIVQLFQERLSLKRNECVKSFNPGSGIFRFF